MKKTITIATLSLLFVPFADLKAQITTTAAPPPSDPMTWLVKSVCVDSQNRVIPADPYGGCPAGTSIRKIQVGDPVPYHNIDHRGQHHDSYPVHDQNGNTMVIATFDHPPFNAFHLFNNSDGYDVYAVRDNWVTALQTSTGGSYAVTFFGKNCNTGGGWNFFPASGFQNAGHATVPIMGVYWEQSGESFPGVCPSRYATNTMTSWKFQRGYAFGGIHGNPTKTMDTMISHHGFQPGSTLFLQKGHMEVFYFTKEYGITRWEVWRPVQQKPARATECKVPATVTYQGINFVVVDCRDWSKVIPASLPEIPVWPIPNLNLLQHAHFDSGFTSSWARAGVSPAGNLINWSRHNSLASRDAKFSPIGVSYLVTNCGAGGDGKGGDPAVQKIYQDIPASKFVSGQTYAYGIIVRTETGKGTLQVGIQQIDAKGNVLWGDSVQGAVTSDNGSSPSPGEADSVYLSSAFIYKTAKINLIPNAVKIRFCFTPITPQTFDILEAWFARWPVPTQGFGTAPPAS